MKRFLSIILAVCFMVTMFAACGKSGDPKQTTTQTEATSSQTTTAETEPDPAKKFFVSDNPLELTIHMHIWNRIAFDENWPVWKKASEMTNLSLKGTASATASDSGEAFNIMMASKEISDIVCGTRDNFNKYGPEGAFIPLNDLINEHAPNLKAYLDANPDSRRFMTAPDGNIYFINYIMDGLTSEGWFIRQDWLDKLSLATPTNADELYNVFTAFKEGDPNENGKPDEVPFFDPDTRNGVLSLLGLFGITRFSVADENGKIFYGRYCDEYKEAMLLISKWYGEGLIDQEIFTRGSNAREILFGDNLGGCVHYWFGSTAKFNDTLKDKVPGFNIQAMPPPANHKGEVKEYTSRTILMEDGWAISSSNKYPVETIKFFDFWWSEEGRRLANFGLEDEHYDMIDGKPIFKDTILNNPDKMPMDFLYEIGAQLNWGYQMDYTYEMQLLNPLARKAVEMYIVNDWIVPPFPSFSMNAEEQDTLDRLGEPIWSYTNEMTVNWILGNLSVEDTWDEYVATLKQLEIDEFLAVQQSAYERYLAQ